MNNRTRKTMLTLILGILILLVTIGISYAVHLARITKTNETGTTIITKKLEMRIENSNFVCSDIVPGDQCTKEFTITNTGTTEQTYNIYMEDTINDFYSDLEDFVYTIIENNNEIVTEKIAPSSNKEKQYIGVNLTIPANTSKTYKIVLKYKYLDNIDQSAYEGSVFKTIIGADTDYMTEITEEDEEYSNTCTDYGMVGEIGETCSDTIREVTLIEEDKCYVKTIKNPYCSVEEVEDDVEFETEEECIQTLSENAIYGKEVAIYHDIYYADQNKYSQGKNERYVTYCTPFKRGDKREVRYCSLSGGKGKCITASRNVCSSANTMKDLGKTSTKYQTRTEYFMDTGWNEGGVITNNWHIKSFCNENGAYSTYKNGNNSGYYYCKNKTELHDWYHDETSSSANIDNIRSTCSVPKYYAFGTPTTSDTTNYNTLVDYYYSGGQGTKAVLNALYSDDKTQGVCLVTNNEIKCFKYGNWNKTLKDLSEYFGQSIEDVHYQFNSDALGSGNRVVVDEYRFSKSKSACYVLGEGVTEYDLNLEYNDEYEGGLCESWLEFGDNESMCYVTIYPEGYEQLNGIVCKKEINKTSLETSCYIRNATADITNKNVVSICGYDSGASVEGNLPELTVEELNDYYHSYNNFYYRNEYHWNATKVNQ